MILHVSCMYLACIIRQFTPPLQILHMFTGTLKEEYTLLEDGALRVLSTTSIGADSCAVEQVYTRSTVSKEAFLQQSRSRNGSYNDVMKNQVRLPWW